MKYTIDLENVKSREDLHLVLKNCLPLPDYYGNNLDALYDVLTDFTDETEIVVNGIREIPEELQGYADAFLRVLEDGAAETGCIDVKVEAGEEETGGRIIGILMAAGRGSRFGDGMTPKQFLELDGEPVFLHSLKTMMDYGGFDAIVITVPVGWVERTNRLLEKGGVSRDMVHVIEGSDVRADTLYIALKYIDEEMGMDEDTLILTQDAARPFLEDELIGNVVESTKIYGAATAGIRAVDTLVTSVDGLEVADSLPRDYVYQIQTPQAFYGKKYMEIWKGMSSDRRFKITDVSGVFEYAGERVAIVKGDRFNMKITYPEDLVAAEALIMVKKNL